MYGVVNYDPNKVYTHISDDLKAVWKKVCMSLCDLASFNHIYWEKMAENVNIYKMET